MSIKVYVWHIMSFLRNDSRMCFGHAWTLYRGFTDECADNNTAYCSISVYLVTSDKILEKDFSVRKRFNEIQC